MSNEKILFIEDDEAILKSLTEVLERDHYQVFPATSGEMAIELLQKHTPDLILLDLNLPGMSGATFAKQFKMMGDHASIPIIVLTGISYEEVLVDALENFADDYITKPFRPRVLKARLAAALRRQQRASGELERKEKDLVIDSRSLRVFLQGFEIQLTRTEFYILDFLMRHPNVPFSREDIIRHIRGSDYHVVSRSLDYQIFCLRKKMGEFAYMIETVRGIGFRFRDGE